MREIAMALSENLSEGEFSQRKIAIARKHRLMATPSNADVLMGSGQAAELRNLLLGKPVRRASGVSVVAVMTEPRLCPHGKCIYCPGGPKSALGDVPMAYTGREPASMRGARTGYDAYLQVFTRLEQYVAQGHVPEKIELIVMGGTLPSYEESYQRAFLTDCFNAMNDFSMFFDEDLDYARFARFFELPGSVRDEQRVRRVHERIRALKAKNHATLEQAHAQNEHARVRCIGMTLETRADFSDLFHANRMLEQGATRVELGVQSVYDDVLEMTGRSHGAQENIDATAALKDLGFKVNYHLMPGLPGVSYARDLEGLKQVFSDTRYRPDMIKIYPTGVFPGTVLYDYYAQGMYTPLRIDDAVELLAEFKPHIPTWCRVMRVQRDIPSTMLVDGVLKTNLRQLIHDRMRALGTRCRCIRCREVGHATRIFRHGEFVEVRYEASGGREVFVSFEDVESDLLLGFVRLRYPARQLRSEITEHTALIRELHVYGSTARLGKEGVVQHRGIGKRLMAEAERIAREDGYRKMLVISGVGVREYYARLGYRRDGPYMGKML